MTPEILPRIVNRGLRSEDYGEGTAEYMQALVSSVPVIEEQVNINKTVRITKTYAQMVSPSSQSNNQNTTQTQKVTPKSYTKT